MYIQFNIFQMYVLFCMSGFIKRAEAEPSRDFVDRHSQTYNLPQNISDRACQFNHKRKEELSRIGYILKGQSLLWDVMEGRM